jgi:addiction module HigA family antidote
MPMMLKSRTITKQMAQVRSKRCMPPVHPGEILREEFLVPLAMSANGLALALGVPATRISEIVNERRGISFRIGPEFWMNLQAHYELEVARGARDAAGYRKIEPAPVDKTGALLARTA